MKNRNYQEREQVAEMPISPNRMYSVKEVAAILRYSELTILRYIRAGTLPHYQLGGKQYRISGRAIGSILGLNEESNS